MSDDLELLNAFVAHHSEEAFARLVERHVNLVYSVALRHTRNPDHAQEITQAVFVILARKAAGLNPNTILSGWLYQTARLNAFSFNRAEARRRRHQEEIAMQSPAVESEPAAWEQVAPLLDNAIAGLGETDRNAVVLHYLEGKQFREVGVALGASEDAAKMRVHRALEKLRKFFTRKGVVLSSAALAGMISARAVEAAPVGLAAISTAAAVKGAAVSAATLALVKGATNIMAWTTKLKIAATVGVAALVAFESYQVIDQKKQLTDLQDQLQQQRQQAQQQAAAQQASIDDLKQQKLALVEEKEREIRVTDKLLDKQRAETAAAVARADAAIDRADKFARDTGFFAVGALLNDPANRELTRIQRRQELKARYAGLARELKLSPEDADKFYDLLTANEMKKQDRVAALWQKNIDADTALAERDNEVKDLRNQISTWLGADAEKQYERIQRDINADDAVSALNRELGANTLSDDQAKRLRAIIHAQPEISFDSEDLFRPQDSIEALIQQITDRSQNNLKAAADFLTPDQLAVAKTLSDDNLKLLRRETGLAKKLFQNTASQATP